LLKISPSVGAVGRAGRGGGRRWWWVLRVRWRQSGIGSGWCGEGGLRICSALPVRHVKAPAKHALADGAV